MLGPQVHIIFTTAHIEYAIKGFDLAITDFLLKPINYSRFLQACALAQKRIGATDNQMPGKTESLFVKDGYNWVKINFDDLLYIKAEDNYSSLFTKDKRVLTRMTLQEVLQKLPEINFVRVHKSYLVNVAAIEKLESYQLIIMGARIPVSKPFREELKKRMIK
jgi:DNA-binding LytR/AlgR family response regulator